jgi:tRNA(Ile)-lysidine synthase
MLALLHEAKVNCAVAHCNFGLRGDESEQDETFVRKIAGEMRLPIHVERFPATDDAKAKGISIQMAARELRYRWFDELAGQYGYDHIAIAHNRNDRIETLFINLARGTGIHGITGMKPQNGKIIRPLLFASRDEIAAYAQEYRIAFREDSSNTGDKYVRNYIRHHLIPGLENYFPGFQQTMERDMDNFTGVEFFYNEAIERYKKNTCKTNGDTLEISIPALLESPSPSALLYEIIKPFGFSNAAVSSILSKKHGSGQQFFSKSHRLLRNRQSLIIKPSDNNKLREYFIEECSGDIFSPVRLHVNIFDKRPGFTIPADPDIACLDYSRLQFPLSLRKWLPGDSFYPLGMKGVKKLSDFFIDNKLSVIDKENIWLLTSAGEIVWITGLRIDDRFKITGNTKRIVKIEYERL